METRYDVHDYEPGEARHQMHTDPLCRVCGAPENASHHRLDELPKPVKRDSRIAFSIAWFDDERKASTYAAHVREQGVTYNGGYFHGMPCGRDTAFDYVDPDLGPLFAVTD